MFFKNIKKINITEFNFFKKGYKYKSFPNNINVKGLPIYVPLVKYGKVIKVYDGDSITIAARIENINDSQIYKFNLRLNRIDTPELRTKNEKEKEYGLKIREILKERILNKIVKVHFEGLDKYGRYLADVIYENENINDWLLYNKYAMMYNGGKKLTFNENQFNPLLEEMENIEL